MFSDLPRQSYANNQLVDVICQLRFPAILSIDAQEPFQFQELIRDEFPKFFVRTEKAPPIPSKNPLEPPKDRKNYHFLAEDDSWRVNLSYNFVALTCGQYEKWESFAQKLDKLLAIFIHVYHPAYFERVGLRYVNAVSRRSLALEDVNWRELIQPEYLGFLSHESLEERLLTQNVQNLEMALDGGCRLKLHSGLGMVQRGRKTDSEPKFILDLDVSMSGNVSVSQIAPALSTLHMHADTIFENALTDRLRQAMRQRAF